MNDNYYFVNLHLVQPFSSSHFFLYFNPILLLVITSYLDFLIFVYYNKQVTAQTITQITRETFIYI